MAEILEIIIILCCGVTMGIYTYYPYISNIFKNLLIEEKVVKTPLADQYLKDGFAFVYIGGIRIRIPSLSKVEEEIEDALKEPIIEAKIPMDKVALEVAYDNTNNRIFWDADRWENGDTNFHCIEDDQLLIGGQLKKIIAHEQRELEIDWIKKQQDVTEVSQFFFEFKEEFDRKLRLIPSIKDRYILIRKKMNDTISALNKIETKISNLEKRYNY